MGQCYETIPTTLELRVKGNAPCEIRLRDKCIHWRGEDVPYFYPAFNVGLREPFIIALCLCEYCAKTATIEAILTPERWKRMRMILLDHDEDIPKRSEVTMELVRAKFIPPQRGSDWEANNYSYALAA